MIPNLKTGTSIPPSGTISNSTIRPTRVSLEAGAVAFLFLSLVGDIAVPIDPQRYLIFGSSSALLLYVVSAARMPHRWPLLQVRDEELILPTGARRPATCGGADALSPL